MHLRDLVSVLANRFVCAGSQYGLCKIRCLRQFAPDAADVEGAGPSSSLSWSIHSRSVFAMRQALQRLENQLIPQRQKCHMLRKQIAQVPQGAKTNSNI